MTIDPAMLEAAKAVAELCAGLDARDFARIGAQLSPDATWTIVGRPDRFEFGGPKTTSEFLESIQGALPVFERFQFAVQAWARNGDVVFVEAKAEGRGPGALNYSNRYLMRFLLRDGLIVDALEHYDPFEARAFVEQLTV